MTNIVQLKEVFLNRHCNSPQGTYELRMTCKNGGTVLVDLSQDDLLKVYKLLEEKLDVLCGITPGGASIVQEAVDRR